MTIHPPSYIVLEWSDDPDMTFTNDDPFTNTNLLYHPKYNKLFIMTTPHRPTLLYRLIQMWSCRAEKTNLCLCDVKCRDLGLPRPFPRFMYPYRSPRVGSFIIVNIRRKLLQMCNFSSLNMCTKVSVFTTNKMSSSPSSQCQQQIYATVPTT